MRLKGVIMEEIVGGRGRMLVAVGIIHREAGTARICSIGARGGIVAAA
jgi:hypothetical protein